MKQVDSSIWKERSNWRVLGKLFMSSCKDLAPGEVVQVAFLHRAILELKHFFRNSPCSLKITIIKAFISSYFLHVLGELV